MHQYFTENDEMETKKVSKEQMKKNDKEHKGNSENLYKQKCSEQKCAL